MKTAILSIVAASALSVLSVSSAYAMGVPTNELRAEIQSTLPGSGNNVNVFVNDGVVTLTGHVADSHVRYLVAQAANNFAGVTGVKNYLSTRH